MSDDTKLAGHAARERGRAIKAEPVGGDLGTLISSPVAGVDWAIYDEDTGRTVAVVLYSGDDTQEHSDRLAACWNACEGINPEAVPDLLAACKAYRDNYTTATYDDGPEMHEVDDDTGGLILDAIAKAEGGAV